MNTEYDDIIHLPHYEPKRHPRMPLAARAAQFAPFAAVAGHDAAIREEGRTTDSWTELGDFGNSELNRKMEQLIPLLPQHPTVAIEYFLPDSHKSGGSYQTVTGNVKRIDEYERVIELMGGRKIAIDLIKSIQIQDCPLSL
jgi:hypothetical protein